MSLDIIVEIMSNTRVGNSNDDELSKYVVVPRTKGVKKMENGGKKCPRTLLNIMSTHESNSLK